VRFYTSAKVQLRSSAFSDVAQCLVSSLLLMFGTNMLSQNVGNKLPISTVKHPRKVKTWKLLLKTWNYSCSLALLTFGAGIKFPIWCAGDRKLHEGCIWRVL